MKAKYNGVIFRHMRGLLIIKAELAPLMSKGYYHLYFKIVDEFYNENPWAYMDGIFHEKHIADRLESGEWIYDNGLSRAVRSIDE